VTELLLDTCAFLWLALDPAKIPPPAAALLNDTRNPRLLSQVSVLEIVLKYRIGRLPLPLPPEDWIPSRRRFFHLRDLPLLEDIIFQSQHLAHPHPDPFDRLLATLARQRDCVVLSSDSRIQDLGARVVWNQEK
jgi:PIN domain nuclease of toxin-antitoxin system